MMSALRCGNRKAAVLRALTLMAGSVFLTAVLSAQEPSPQNPPPRTPDKSATCSIAGTVVRAGTNEPLKRAHIYLYPLDGRREGAYSGLTDAAGQFLLQGLEPGRYHLQVTRAGFATQQYGQGSSAGSNAILTLNPGKKISDLIFRMIPGGVISGRVIDEDGDPVSGTTVMAMQSHMYEGQRKLFESQTAITNDLGEYRLYGMLRGRYYIRTEYAEWQSPKNLRSTPDDSTAASRTAYVPIFYPGTADISRAGAITLLPGQEIPSLDVRLLPTRAVRIRGRVFNAVLGKPATGCCVYLKPRDSNVE